MEENYLENIRGYIISEQARTIVRDYNANKSKLETYYNIGKELAEAGKHYGEGIIKKYSERLTLEFGKGYSTRNLKYMRNFYNFQKGQTMFAQLTWSHFILILSIKDPDEIKFYIDLTIRDNLGVRALADRIKSDEYGRLPLETKIKLIRKGVKNYGRKYLENIRGFIISEQARTIVRDYNANKSKLETYYNIGKKLSEAGKYYGEGIIKKYSKKLTKEFGKGYGAVELRKMRSFYRLVQKCGAVHRVLTWNHYLKLLPLKDINEIKFIIQKDSFRNKYVEVDTDQDIFEA